MAEQDFDELDVQRVVHFFEGGVTAAGARNLLTLKPLRDPSKQLVVENRRRERDELLRLVRAKFPNGVPGFIAPSVPPPKTVAPAEAELPVVTPE